MSLLIKPKHFHAYATANNNFFYLADIKNLIKLSKTIPGIESIHLYIAISKVRNANFMDRLFIMTIHKIFKNHLVGISTNSILLIRD